MAADKDTILLYPLPAISHLAPMIELAKLFLAQHFDVAVVLVDRSFEQTQVPEFIARVSAAQPSITFHQLPPLAGAAADADPTQAFNFYDLLRRNNENLKAFVADHSKNHVVRGIVIDFINTNALEVAAELALPAYPFFTSGAFVLAAFIYLPTLHDIVTTSFKEIGDGLLEFPGLPSLPANHLPAEILDRESEAYKQWVNMFDRLTRANGVFINSFESLEARAVRTLRDGLCTPGRPTPPFYCIGPLLGDGQTGEGAEKEEKHECLSWLDSQPEDSVVFLCFGSAGTFKVEQLKEIAEGLERSEQRFLWVVRAPPVEGQDFRFVDHLKIELELEALLPPGFLERTKDRGLVVKKWAPQTAVLAHKAVGGFVTHCGWSSVLESIVNGVAMIAWPQYAEQRMNKVFMVEEMQLAVAIEGHDKELVAATEVEAKVRWLMASESGKELRGRSKVVKERAAEARSVGGSSDRALLEAVEVLRG